MSTPLRKDAIKHAPFPLTPTKKQVKVLKTTCFKNLPPNLKRKVPQARSCALCLKRPVDFQHRVRIFWNVPANDTGCPRTFWSKTTPYYTNECTFGEWE